MAPNFKLGLLGFVIVITILYTVYSHRIYTPHQHATAVETVCIDNHGYSRSC